MKSGSDAERLALALRHAAAAKLMDEAKAAEGALRAELVAACFPAGVGLGMNTCDLGGGFFVKAEVRPSLKYSPGELAVGLQLMKDHGELGAELAGRLAVYKPEVRYGELKKLPEPFAGIMGPVVTVEPGSVSVELKEPRS